jgi:hypothetical protein
VLPIRQVPGDRGNAYHGQHRVSIASHPAVPPDAGAALLLPLQLRRDSVGDHLLTSAIGVQAILKSGRFLVVGNGRNLHQPIYVDDLVELFLLAVSREAAAGQVILSAGKEAVTTDEMVRAIAGCSRQARAPAPRPPGAPRANA